MPPRVTKVRGIATAGSNGSTVRVMQAEVRSGSRMGTRSVELVERNGEWIGPMRFIAGRKTDSRTGRKVPIYDTQYVVYDVPQGLLEHINRSTR